MDPLVISKASFTALQAGASAVLAGVGGLACGLLLRLHPRTHGVLKLPFGVPTLAAVAAWTSLLRGTSIAYSIWAVLLAHAVFNVPWVALAVAEASGSVPRSWDEAARSLGAGRWERLRSVWWPMVGPAWLGSMAQVFILCSMSFVIVLVLGGGPPVETLETGIFSAVRMGSLDLPRALHLAIWQLGLSLLPWLAVRLLFRPVHLRAQRPSESSRTPPWAWLLATCWSLPYLAFLKDIQPASLGSSLEWGSLRWPLFVSLGISVSTAWVSVLWSVLAIVGLQALGRRLGRWVETLLLLPSGVSTLTLSMGIWMAYSRWIDPFDGSLVALILIQSVVYFPIVLRWLLPITELRTLRLWEMARSQGAGPWQAFWHVEWPRWRAPLWSALSMVAAASLSDVAAASFFSSERLVTLPLLVSRSMAVYRFDQAYLLTALMMLISTLVSLAPDRMLRRSRNFIGG